MEAGSWADSVGLEAGDVLLEINHTAVRLMNSEQFLRAISARPLRMLWALQLPPGLASKSGEPLGYTRSYAEYNRKWNQSLALPPTPMGDNLSPLFVDPTAMYDLQELDRLEGLSQDWWVQQQLRHKVAKKKEQKKKPKIIPKPKPPPPPPPPKPPSLGEPAGCIVSVSSVRGIPMDKVEGNLYLTFSLWHGEETMLREYRMENELRPLEHISCDAMPIELEENDSSIRNQRTTSGGVVDFDFDHTFTWTPRDEHYIVIQLWEECFWNRNQLLGGNKMLRYQNFTLPKILRNRNYSIFDDLSVESECQMSSNLVLRFQ